MTSRRHLRLVIFVAFMVAFASRVNAQTPLVVGMKSFLEQKVLCEVIKQHLEFRLRVPVRCSEVASPDQEILNGSIDLYVEYTGTAYKEILGHSHPEDQIGRVGMMEVIKKEYDEKGLIWLDSLGFEDTFVMVVRREDTQRLRSDKLSDARKITAWRIGSGPDFQLRADGLGGLIETYGFKLRGRPVTAEVDSLFRLLEARAVDMIAANSTDTLIDDRSVRQLKDDKHYFPDYSAAIVLRKTTTARYPRIQNVLAELHGNISDKEMRGMIDQVNSDTDKRTPEKAAADFLDRLGTR